MARKCPRCSCLHANRSHRSLLERFYLGFRPYRCADCNFRFMVFTFYDLFRPQA